MSFALPIRASADQGGADAWKDLSKSRDISAGYGEFEAIKRRISIWFPSKSEPPPSGLWITRARMAEKRFCVCMNISTQATQRGPKHRARTPRWPRVTTLAAAASMFGLMATGMLALQPASAVQDATTHADVMLMPDPPTCDVFACTWTLTPATDAYSFILGRDSAVPGGVIMIDVQSAEVMPGIINAWSARLVDPSRIVIVDFFAGTSRVWDNGGIALQASPNSADPASLMPSAISAMTRLQQPFDPALDGRVRIRQMFVPSVALRTLAAPTEQQLATFGSDLSAVATLKFSEPVSGFDTTDLRLSPMSQGCVVSSVLDSGDHYNFTVLVRSCSSQWMSMSLLPGAVAGNGDGPDAEVYFAPIQPAVLAGVQAQATPTPTASPTASPSIAPTSTPTPTLEPSVTVTPAPSVTVTPEQSATVTPAPTATVAPEVTTPLPVPPAVEPATPGAEPVAPEQVEPPAAESVPEPQAEPVRASLASQRSDEQAGAISVVSDGGSDGGTPTKHVVAAEPIANEVDQQEPASSPEWLMPVAAGLAAVGGVTAGAVAAQRLLGRLSGRVKLRLPRRRPVGFGAA